MIVMLRTPQLAVPDPVGLKLIIHSCCLTNERCVPV